MIARKMGRQDCEVDDSNSTNELADRDAFEMSAGSKGILHSERGHMRFFRFSLSVSPAFMHGAG